MDALKAIFWVSFLLIFYAYAGYPALMWSLCFAGRTFRRRGGGGGAPARATGFRPPVTIVISAYNEEDAIDGKIRNTLALRYPRGLLEIIVVSDGSDDRTDEIVKNYRGRVLLRRFEGRIGKSACLNEVVPGAAGEIVVFSDANSMYEEGSVESLVENFSDPRVGFVTGFTKYARPARDPKPGARAVQNNPDAAGIGLYSLLEKLTKAAESRIGSCVGADGAIFAIRKRLYRPLDNADINDLVIPLGIVREGYRGVLAERAFCVEEAPDDAGRQVRITARTLRAVFRNSDLLNPARHGIFSFEFFSHKFCKLSVPFPGAALFFSSLALAIRSGAPFGGTYGAVLLAQAAFIVFGSISGFMGGRGNGPFSRYGSFCHSFLAANLSVLLGWLKFLRGENFITWVTARR